MATEGFKFEVGQEMANVDNIEKIRICIITARWNTHITSALKQGALERLKSFGLQDAQILLLDVPGTFELPSAAHSVVHSAQQFDAVICIGCVIKGDTDHDIYINQSVAWGLTQLNVMQSVPMIFCVLTTNNETQALERSGGKHGNKGAEAADTAIAMIEFKTQIK
ncbi:MAG: 6,7-dimethyl-8-ribityllumazine synthase [Saprospiraceae bacterium]